MQSKNPQKALGVTAEIRSTSRQQPTMLLTSSPMQRLSMTVISVGASFAPGGYRSRTGVVIK
eukprot:5696778-Lingulodinium_polyedra.AAC.1